MHDDKLFYLIQAYYNNTCTDAEQDELLEWIRNNEEPEKLNAAIDRVMASHTTDKVMQPEEVKELYDRIKAVVLPEYRYKKRNIWKPIAVAASTLLIVSLAAYLWFNRSEHVSVAETKKNITNDIPPGTNKATLTLADGSTVLLDEADNGSLAQQGSTSIIKLDSGLLAYNNTKSYEPTAIAQYNVLTTPRGGQYRIVLPDGSKVWLNAASSLKFPVVFNGNERKVQLEGEGYFEVVKDAEKPFKVTLQSLDVEVLGTHFNIAGYKNEPYISTTLLEGSVKVRSGTITKLLIPAQQARLMEPGNIQITTNVDTALTVAWKNGYFNFKGLDIKTVMQQIERWYDVDVEFINTPTKDKYSGMINRNTNLSEVLELLKLSGIDFTIENNVIKVRS